MEQHRVSGDHDRPPIGVIASLYLGGRVAEEWRAWAERQVVSSRWPLRQVLANVLLAAVLGGLLVGLDRLVFHEDFSGYGPLWAGTYFLVLTLRKFSRGTGAAREDALFALRGERSPRQIRSARVWRYVFAVLLGIFAISMVVTVRPRFYGLSAGLLIAGGLTVIAFSRRR